jgi:hypothetical protein
MGARVELLRLCVHPLTLVLLRRPLVPSIQMYSARHLPLWSRLMYLASCARWSQPVQQAAAGLEMLTLCELDTMVDSPTPAYRNASARPGSVCGEAGAHHDGLRCERCVERLDL